MWSIILPDGTELEGVPELSFELNNTVFGSSNATVLPGSFSFPFEVPLTAKNRAALNYPDLVNNAIGWATYPGTWVYLYGSPFFYGTLSIRGCTPSKVNLTMVANPFAQLAELSLGSVDLGGDRTTPANLFAHMDTLATNPLTSDYFFPMVQVVPANIYITPDTAEYYQNFYDPLNAGQAAQGVCVTPMVRLDYLLARIFASAGLDYSFTNDFQDPTVKELLMLYVYSNRDIKQSANANIAPANPATFNLKDFVPNIKATEAIKRLCGMFNLGLFTDVFSRRHSLVPLEKVLAKSPKVDWTLFLASELLLEKQSPEPNYYNYTAPLNDPAPGYPDMETVPRYRSRKAMADVAIATPFVKIYGSYDDRLVSMEYRQFNVPFILVEYLGAVSSYGVRTSVAEITKYETNAVGLPSYQGRYESPYGVSEFVGSPEGAPTTWELRNETYEFSLVAYRGRQNGYPFPNNTNMPYASSSVFFPDTDTRLKIRENGVDVAPAEYSLHWDGEYGLFNRWHARWHNMLANGKNVTASFSLPLDQLLQFSFREKVIVGNMHYVITRMRVSKPLGNGRVLVQATMVSII